MAENTTDHTDFASDLLSEGPMYGHEDDCKCLNCKMGRAGAIIEALMKERAEWAQDAHNKAVIYAEQTTKDVNENITLSLENKRLREALEYIADELCAALCPSVKKTDEEWTHNDRCIVARAALGGDHDT